MKLLSILKQKKESLILVTFLSILVLYCFFAGWPGQFWTDSYHAYAQLIIGTYNDLFSVQFPYHLHILYELGIANPSYFLNNFLFFILFLRLFDLYNIKDKSKYIKILILISMTFVYIHPETMYIRGFISRDIPFILAILIASVSIVLSKKYNWYIFSFILLGIFSTYRMEGILFVLLFLLASIFQKRYYASILLLIVFILSKIFFIPNSIHDFSYWKSSKIDSLVYFYKNNPKYFTKDKIILLEEVGGASINIMVKDVIPHKQNIYYKKYCRPIHTTSVKQKEFDRMYLNFILNNKLYFLNYRYEMIVKIIKRNFKHRKYWNIFVPSNYDKLVPLSQEVVGILNIPNYILVSFTNKLIVKFFYITYNYIIALILLLFVFLHSLYKKKYIYTFVSVIVGIETLLMFLMSPAPYIKYYYMLFLFPLFALGYISHIFKKDIT